MGKKKEPSKKPKKLSPMAEEMRFGMKVLFATTEPGGLDVDALAAKLGASPAKIEALVRDMQGSYGIKSLDGGKGKRWQAVGEAASVIRRLAGAIRDPDEPPELSPDQRHKIIFIGHLLGRAKEGKPLNLLERNMVSTYEMTMPLGLREEAIKGAKRLMGKAWDEPATPLTQADIAREFEIASRTIDPKVKMEAEKWIAEMQAEQAHTGPVRVKAGGKKELEMGDWLQKLGEPKKRK